MTGLPGHFSGQRLQALQQIVKSGVRRDLFTYFTDGETEGQEVRSCPPRSTVSWRQSWGKILSVSLLPNLTAPWVPGPPQGTGQDLERWLKVISFLPQVRLGHSVCQ